MHIEQQQPIAITCDPLNDPCLQHTAEQLARRIGHQTTTDQATIVLAVTPDGLEIRTPGDARSRPVRIDLTARDVSSTAGRTRKQPLAKAVGLGQSPNRVPHVVDATAGFGQDAWVLASLGCRVTAIERSPTVAAVLEDALNRASQTDKEVAANINLLTTDAKDWLSNPPKTCHPIDVIYIDPIFPRTGSTALNRRPMRLLRDLVGNDTDASLLFDMARSTSAHRVVVKRPVRAKPLGNKPAATHGSGRAVRYDVYVKP